MQAELGAAHRVTGGIANTAFDYRLCRGKGGEYRKAKQNLNGAMAQG